MKLLRHLLSVTLVLISSAVLASAIPGRAEVKKVVGSATATKAAGGSSSITQGMILGTGDTITTGAGSTVDIDLGVNGDLLRVDPDTTLKLDVLEIANVTHVRLLHTGTGTAPVDPPAFTLPATPAPPANVIKNMKTRCGYTATIGHDLGVIGAEQAEPDPSTTKPEIKLVLVTGGKVQLQWKKLGFTGIRIELDRGGGTWTFLDIDTKPHYEDAASPAAGATVLWKYRAIYLDGDQVFGQWSDVWSIAVTG